jgi:purine nucleosidase
MRTPVVLSTDCGCEMDDQWALALLALSPAIELRAVIGAHAHLGSLTAETTARVAREVLDHMGVSEPPPVIAGSSVPLAATGMPVESEAVSLLLREAQSFSPERRLAVLVIGCATDVASALMLHPTVAERIEVVAMGFNGWPEGGDLWNVKNDVPAWQTLLASPVPITVGDVAVCLRHMILTRAAARELLAPAGEAGRYLLSIMEEYLDREPDEATRMTGRPDAWPVWDLVTAAHLLGLTRTATYHRPRLREDMSFEHQVGAGEIRWITHVDEHRLWEEFARRVSEAAPPTLERLVEEITAESIHPEADTGAPVGRGIL